MRVTRRNFLKTSLAVVPAATIMPQVFSHAVSAAAREQTSVGNRTLVIVQMAGGNDGLNTIVPANDDRYYALRPAVNVAPERVLPLNSEVGLNPALTAFKTLWDEGVLAAVEGVGYPEPSYSHFQSMDIWQTADPGGRGFEGWVGRYLEGIAGDQVDGFHALAVDRRMPRALYTHQVEVPIVENVDAYLLQEDPQGTYSQQARTEALTRLYAQSPDATPFSALLDNTVRAAIASSKALQAAHATYTSTITYPDSRLGRSLQTIAEAIVGDLGLRVGHVRIGGFDTHAGQLPDHDGLLADTADSMLAFYRDLQAHGRDQDVVMMTWSEFGRRATENGSGGTDHGSAGPMFLAGTPVAGGLYGERPDLGDLVKNNLKFTTDFRSVYSTAIESWLGAPANVVLNGDFERLPLLKESAVA
jgi:uncharacterized protein (DUF1501 family)